MTIFKGSFSLSNCGLDPTTWIWKSLPAVVTDPLIVSFLQPDGFLSTVCFHSFFPPYSSPSCEWQIRIACLREVSKETTIAWGYNQRLIYSVITTDVCPWVKARENPDLGIFFFLLFLIWCGHILLLLICIFSWLFKTYLQYYWHNCADMKLIWSFSF